MKMKQLILDRFAEIGGKPEDIEMFIQGFHLGEQIMSKYGNILPKVESICREEDCESLKRYRDLLK